MSVEERLEQLERQNKWMRRLGAMGVALVVAVFLMGQGKKEELPDLAVRSLVVKDKAGNPRISFGTFPDGKPHLAVRDTDGKIRLTITLRNDSPLLLFSGKDGTQRVLLTTEPGGTSSLEFIDPRAKTRAALSSVGLVLNDKGGNPRAALVTQDDGRSHLVFTDEDAKTRATLSADRDGNPSMSLQDAKGKVIWQAPKE